MRLFLKPAAKGTGVIAGGAIRDTLTLAGYENCFAKMHGTDNAMNNAKGLLRALTSMETFTSVSARRDVTIDYLQVFFFFFFFFFFFLFWFFVNPHFT